VRFAQDNHMVDALASDRSYQPFGEAVLPRRAWGDGLVTDAHGSQSVHDGSAVDPIPITDQVARASRSASIAAVDGGRQFAAPQPRLAHHAGRLVLSPSDAPQPTIFWLSSRSICAARADHTSIEPSQLRAPNDDFSRRKS
jgi:hypothetical protein